THLSPHYLYLYSFPTRRSSDLSMAKSRILRSVKHSNRSLIEHRNRSLVDLGGLGLAQIRRSANVRFLRATVNISSEVIPGNVNRSEEHTSELQSRGHLVCRLLL